MKEAGARVAIANRDYHERGDGFVGKRESLAARSHATKEPQLHIIKCSQHHCSLQGRRRSRIASPPCDALPIETIATEPAFQFPSRGGGLAVHRFLEQ